MITMAMIGKVKRMYFRQKKSVREIVRLTSLSRNTVHAYEAGSRRIPVSALPVVAGTLAVSLEVLFGEERAKAGRCKRGPVPLWQQHIEAVAQLPKSQQQFVARMIEMALAQASTQVAAR
jgi:transcriptional regulator with XRE-family HTH domain